jgi:hypothetical protein
MNLNTTWSGLLESYHLYLPPQKVSKNPQTYCIHGILPKNAKNHLDCLCPFGVNGPIKNENKEFLDFYSFYGFSTQFLNTISKASTLCSAKFLSQEDSKFAYPFL